MDTHSGCDVTDMGLQPEGQSGSLSAKRRAWDEQQERLHGLHYRAAVQDTHFSAPTVKQIFISTFTKQEMLSTAL